MEQGFHHRSKSLLGSSNTYRGSSSADEAQGSGIGGRTIAVQAGRDLRMRGGSLISDAGSSLQAERDIELQAAQNRYVAESYEQHKSSSLMGTGGGSTVAVSMAAGSQIAHDAVENNLLLDRRVRDKSTQQGKNVLEKISRVDLSGYEEIEKAIHEVCCCIWSWEGSHKAKALYLQGLCFVEIAA